VDDLRFKALLEAYGADVERWPVATRDAARARIAEGGADDAALLREAAALDALLGEAAPTPASSALLGRILASATDGRRAGSGGVLAALGSLAPQARFAAASLMLVALGAAAGWAASHDAAAAAAGNALLASAYGETADDLFVVEEL
jgi:hypothetical protein